MPDRRTELRDELAILIATGRELTPDHDQALADVFVDRLVKRPNRPALARRLVAGFKVPRALLGAAILVLAVLGLGTAVSVVNTSVSGGASSQARANVLVVPKVMKVPVAKAVKVPVLKAPEAKVVKVPLIPPSKLAHAFPRPKVKTAP